MNEQFLLEIGSKQAINTKRANHNDLIERIKMLKGHDKILMRMYIQQGYTLNQLSRLAGVSQSTISRRIEKVRKRLTSGKIDIFFQNVDRFAPTERKILKDHLREGMSQRQISKKRKLTRYRVRKALDKFNSISTN